MSVRISGSPESVRVIFGTNITLSDNIPLTDSTIYRVHDCGTEIWNVLILSEVPSQIILSDHE